MSTEYNNYILSHVENVKKAYNWLVEHEIVSNSLMTQIALHDVSKWRSEEYTAYDNYFYGKKTEKVKVEFNYAWLHHIHNNPHHWQHWLLQEDEGKLKALEMPKEYVIEMICDWWSFSWKKDKLTEIFDWYATNKPKMILHQNTLQLVENILTKIRNKVEYGD
jgi:hypothetical protein